VNLAQTITAIALLAATSVPRLQAADPKPQLSADQVVNSLIQKNEERSQTLLHSESTRVYHLTYRGFPGDREAEMTVEATYDRPSSKEFKIVSQTGSKLVQDRSPR
jgi:hypothetical protein